MPGTMATATAHNRENVQILPPNEGGVTFTLNYALSESTSVGTFPISMTTRIAGSTTTPSTDAAGGSWAGRTTTRGRRRRSDTSRSHDPVVSSSVVSSLTTDATRHFSKIYSPKLLLVGEGRINRLGARIMRQCGIVRLPD